jgi:hypothetical protein
LAKKKDARFEEEGTGLGESAPEVDPANFDVDKAQEMSESSEIDLSPATSSLRAELRPAALPAEPALMLPLHLGLSYPLKAQPPLLQGALRACLAWPWGLGQPGAADQHQ